MTDPGISLTSSLANAIKMDEDGGMKVKAPANPFLQKSGEKIVKRKKVYIYCQFIWVYRTWLNIDWKVSILLQELRFRFG